MLGLMPAQLTQRCPNLPPGQCCRSLGLESGSEVVLVQDLMELHMAAIWDQRATNPNPNNQFAGIQGCSGVPAEYKFGPGNWYFAPFSPEYQNQGLFPFGAHGASYFKFPQSLPEDPAESRMAHAEGFGAFSHGGSRWFIDKAIFGSNVIPRSLTRKRRRSHLEGTAYIIGPTTWTWPTFITVNGTEYTDGGVGDLIYKSRNGETLDLTSLRS